MGPGPGLLRSSSSTSCGLARAHAAGEADRGHAGLEVRGDLGRCIAGSRGSRSRGFRRSSTSCSTRRRFGRLGARFRRDPLYGPPLGTARRCWPRPSGTPRTRTSTHRCLGLRRGLSLASARAIASCSRGGRRPEPAGPVFIDELDAGRHGRPVREFQPRADRTLNQCSSTSTDSAADRVVIIAASNSLEDLDPALLRPGRFDSQILVAPPDLAGREAILRVIPRSHLASDVDLEIVVRSPGHTVATRRAIDLQRGQLSSPVALEQQYIRHSDLKGRWNGSSPACKRVRRDWRRRSATCLPRGGHAVMSHLVGDPKRLSRR